MAIWKLVAKEEAPAKRPKLEPTAVAPKAESAVEAGDADHAGAQVAGEENLAKQDDEPVMPGEDLIPVTASARTRRRYVRTPAGECAYCWRIGLYSQVALHL